MQKIALLLALVVLAGHAQKMQDEASALNSLATFLLTRKPPASFNPSMQRFAARNPSLTSFRPVVMDADSSERTFELRDVYPAIVSTAGLLVAMVPSVALAEDDGDGIPLRFLLVLGVPVTAVLWVLFNIGRPAFQQLGTLLQKK
mmetsp:Transcript_103310/g.179233  ORF Transcript_103310/g.179233 Transcript_103310/m.179233 type:complete len:145 (-) Transcript_103310:149-583(-)